MKLSKILSMAVVATAMIATVADAGSIGRSGGGGSRSSSSFSSGSSASKSSSFSQPSKPAVAPAPATARPGGIGGNSASVGVRKSEVTNGVKQDIAATKPSTSSVGSTGSSYSSTAPHYSTSPTYSSPAPAPVVVQSGGGFGSTFAGAMAGTVVGNALFGNHGHSGGGTTVINNGTPSGGGTVVAGSPGVSNVSDGQFNPGGVVSQPKKEYTVWSFIADIIGFVFVVAILLGVAWIFYKGFQLVRNYVNKERGVSTQPFNPTQQFWAIQNAFAAADVTALKGFLGPDLVDELTRELAPSELTLKNVSHEVRLSNNTEFSIWYKFNDDGEEVNQVWHYEKFGKDWKLNGIENV